MDLPIFLYGGYIEKAKPIRMDGVAVRWIWRLLFYSIIENFNQYGENFSNTMS